MMNGTRCALGVLAVLALAGGGYGQSPIVQSDWSGGAGVPGPVAAFGDTFDTATGVAFATVPGQLALGSTPLATIEESFSAFAASSASPGWLSRRIRTGDIDGDGVLDMVVGEFFGVSWWQGDGEGGWGHHQIDTTFMTPTQIGIWNLDLADLDDDGDLDVLVAAYHGEPAPQLGKNGRLLWYENLAGDGTSWQRHDLVEFFWGANSIHAADLDGDGDLDVLGSAELTAIGNLNPAILWLENVDGDAQTWTTHVVEESDQPGGPDFYGFAARAVDFDGDGDLDLIGAEQNQRHWWDNLDGTGTSWRRHDIGAPLVMTFVNYNAAADMDGDGDLDYVATSLEGAAWWENLDGGGTSWGLRLITSLTGAIQIQGSVLADLDGDADQDLAFVTTGSLSHTVLAWRENVDGAGLAWAAHTGPTLDFETSCCADAGVWAADMDDDGMLELTTACRESTVVGVWEATEFIGAGTLTGSIVERPAATRWSSITASTELMTPDATVTLEVRAGDDPGALGSFEMVLDPMMGGGGLEDVIDLDADYLQYRVGLAAGAGQVSPVVDEISVGLDAAACSGDLDGDDAVGTADLLELLAAWGPCARCAADLDGDGTVGTADLLALLAAWGACP